MVPRFIGTSPVALDDGDQDRGQSEGPRPAPEQVDEHELMSERGGAARRPGCSGLFK